MDALRASVFQIESNMEFHAFRGGDLLSMVNNWTRRRCRSAWNALRRGSDNDGLGVFLVEKPV